MGGVTLTYMERSGSAVPLWDFRVDGVTSISIDLHKYGYAAKGAGGLAHRTKALRAHQTFTTDRWLGGRYGSSGILGTKGSLYVTRATLFTHIATREATQQMADDLFAVVASGAVKIRIDQRYPLAEVARAAGISNAAVLHHFGSVEAVHAALMERMIVTIFKEAGGVQLPTPFPRMTYAEAMGRYGSDKPDLRFDMPLYDVTAFGAASDPPRPMKSVREVKNLIGA